jgi:hypothetical protein
MVLAAEEFNGADALLRRLAEPVGQIVMRRCAPQILFGYYLLNHWHSIARPVGKGNFLFRDVPGAS